MRYRKLDKYGDYTFGHDQADFYIDSPDAVGQLVVTRLKLFTGEWFLDITEGTPYSTQILGYNHGQNGGTNNSYDLAIQDRILETEGVSKITSYSSDLNTSTRALAINATIDTIYGTATLTTVI